MGEKQETLIGDKKKGHWVEAEFPEDPNLIDLEVDEEFIGRYVGTKPNPIFKKDVIHMFEVDEDDEIKKMYGKSNLNKWIDPIAPGTILKVKRLEDQNISQPKPLQKFKVWIWEEI